MILTVQRVGLLRTRENYQKKITCELTTET